jgi:hypothetical protein
LWLISLEAFQTPIFASGPDREGFNLGRYRNFVEVFGRDRRWWFLPRYTRLVTFTETSYNLILECSMMGVSPPQLPTSHVFCPFKTSVDSLFMLLLQEILVVLFLFNQYIFTA